MSNVAIRAENLGKLYRIGAKQERYRTIRESVTVAIASPFRRLFNTYSKTQDANSIWALKDVSLEIKQGEVVGLIGRNGAGKSTLLKVLSRITEPTKGWADIHGRIGSLLEVGTGFHPELTGRENIYLNGAILGMKRTVIERQFDEIVAFAEVEKFIDTQVKHYSSGMYLRLAFAVAAHLEPEILLVDEVLAVGDAAFQKKCLGKMEEVAHEGRTVVFVSHNMAAISALCPRVIALKDGCIWADGTTEVIPAYLDSISESSRQSLRDGTNHDVNKEIWFTGIWFTDSRDKEISVAITGNELTVCLGFESRRSAAKMEFAFTVYDYLGRQVMSCDTLYSGNGSATKALPAHGILKCRIPKLPLVAGEYRMNILVRQGGEYKDHIPGAARLTVEQGDFYGTSKSPPSGHGPILVEHTWQLCNLELANHPDASSIHAVIATD